MNPNTLIDVIVLRNDRFLGIAWKDGEVHNLFMAIDEDTARAIAESSLRQKPALKEVFANIEKMIETL